MICWVVYLLRIFKIFNGLMNNPVLWLGWLKTNVACVSAATRHWYSDNILYIYIYIYKTWISKFWRLWRAVVVLWFVTPFNLLDDYQCFERIYHLHGQDRSEPVWECSLNILKLLPSVTRTVYSWQLASFKRQKILSRYGQSSHS